MKNMLDIKDRHAFRAWLAENHQTQPECWVAVKRGKPTEDTEFRYLDAVEEALCFGWIDSTTKRVDGITLQRFSPRRENSPWSELNKARVRRLERLGLMTDAGRAVLPDMDAGHFQIDPEIVSALKQARVWTKFSAFPALYQRVRAYNVAFYKKRNPEIYNKALLRLIEETKKGRLFGEWNDYGRLTEQD